MWYKSRMACLIACTVPQSCPFHQRSGTVQLRTRNEKGFKKKVENIFIKEKRRSKQN